MLFMPFSISLSSWLEEDYWDTNISGLFLLQFFLLLLIELFQFYTRVGTFEVDDIIHNTLGAVFGY